MSNSFVQVAREGRIGHILLDRPKALNALDLSMIRAVAAALNAWRHDPGVHAVVVEGAGGRAFCAGGDIRVVRSHALAGEAAEIEAFFAEEYALNLAIAEYPKPYVALIDGICMGGGIGLSVHGAFRVTSETGLFAMPETAIAMFPDVGATHVLPRLPGALGLYLGLTGTRLSGADAVHAGIATHLVGKERMAGLRAEIAAHGVAAIAAAAESLPAFTLAPHRAAIDRCIGADTLGEVIARLEVEGTDWARETLAALRVDVAVFAAMVVRRHQARRRPDAARRPEGRTRADPPCHGASGFRRGRAGDGGDKDRAPKWSPPTIEAVDHSAIQAMLA